MGHGDEDEAKTLGIVLRHPDGTPYTKEEVIIKRRGAFAWLPVLCSNDLVHGSWWFVWGSVGCVIFALFPLCDRFGGSLNITDDDMNAAEFAITWVMVLLSSFFFGVGSWAFLRAFEEPSVRPLFWWYKHAQTDELLGAWLFFFGVVPAAPYAFVYWAFNPSEVIYLGALGVSIVAIFATGLFVKATYPHDNAKHMEPFILPRFKKLFGPQIWVTRHCANDWIAACWIILWGNLLYCALAFLVMIAMCATGDREGIFVWVFSFINALLFLIGSAYFVSGSYPFAGQFYYYRDRGNLDFVPSVSGFGHSKSPVGAAAANAGNAGNGGYSKANSGGTTKASAGGAAGSSTYNPLAAAEDVEAGDAGGFAAAKLEEVPSEAAWEGMFVPSSAGQEDGMTASDPSGFRRQSLGDAEFTPTVAGATISPFHRTAGEVGGDTKSSGAGATAATADGADIAVNTAATGGAVAATSGSSRPQSAVDSELSNVSPFHIVTGTGAANTPTDRALSTGTRRSGASGPRTGGTGSSFEVISRPSSDESMASATSGGAVLISSSAGTGTAAGAGAARSKGNKRGGSTVTSANALDFL